MENTKNKENSYKFGEVTAIVQSTTDMPLRLIGGIARQPTSIFSHWLPEAFSVDDGELTSIMSTITDIPNFYPAYEQSSFYMGYTHKLSEISHRRTIGNQIHTARQAKCLSIEQLANLTGINEDTIDKIERGKWIEETEAYKKLSDTLSLNISI